MVAIVVDAVYGYGRAVARGAMRYANLKRRWLLHEEFRIVSEPPRGVFPDCDGAVMSGVGREALTFFKKRCRHIVRCSGSADPNETPVVCLDDEAVGAMAARHLMDCHLRHFAYYGNTSGVASKRYSGFAAELARHGFTCQETDLGWHDDAVSILRYWGKVIEWLQSLPKPAGIMAVDDRMGHELAAACLEAGIGVPDRIAIIGVNNDDLLCDSAWPPLSSVEVDYSRAGYIAASVLDRLMRGEKLAKDERQIRLPPLGVVRRTSTDMLAVDDPVVADAIRYIREHACDPCSVSDVLKEVPTNRRWLERRFTAKLGRTLHDEILRVQIEAAKRLLLQPGLTMPDIALHSGFATSASLGRAFLRSEKTTPSAYRRDAMRTKT